MKDSLQVAILLSHLAPYIDNLKWLNERGPRSNTLNMNADGWHKVCKYLPHLQAIRVAEKRTSAIKIVVPPQMSEKSVDATTLSIDTGVQAVVQTTEFLAQFSPVLVHQEISAVPGVSKMSIDTRPIFLEAGVLAIPTLLEKSIGASIVGKAVGSLADAVSKSLESIIGAVAQNETSADQMEPAPRVSPPMRMARVYVYFVTFPIGLLNAEEIGMTCIVWELMEKCWREDRAKRPNVLQVLKKFCTSFAFGEVNVAGVFK